VRPAIGLAQVDPRALRAAQVDMIATGRLYLAQVE
jgi:hypothetical protein